DRLLKRKNRMAALLVQHGYFPIDMAQRKALEPLNPYELRAKGLDSPLSPAEFARALFHINQRRGFKSNRKTDKKDNDSGALKTAISALRQQLDTTGLDGKARTVGELLWRRMQNGTGVRARYREQRVAKDDGKTRIDKSYDLYIDRAMIESEFDALWSKQAALNPQQFNDAARIALKDCLLHQRPLKPVKPGRCTLLPDQERAPLALPSQQRFRIYQEVNHLRILGDGLQDTVLTLAQRDAMVEALERNSKRSFTQIRTLLKLSGPTQFNLEDPKRQELKGNATSTLLAKKDFFGPAWHEFDLAQQDAIVMRLLTEESEAALVSWLQSEFDVDEARAETIANGSLAEGYGSLSAQALARILPTLSADVLTYDKAVQAAGFEHHSHISHAASTGEILPALPYYGEYLPRHVGFGTGSPQDPPEKRFGKIANPTVHIGLNQVRTVVNALIKRYGHPSEVIVEVARELKQNQEQRKEQQQQQAQNQKRNERLRADAAAILGASTERVRHADIQKLILWEELGRDPAERRCPYSGVQISAAMVLSDEVEIEHILPFSMTLDDSLNNKTVALRRANRVKGNRTPFDARADLERQGWAYDAMLARAELMPKNKRYRFGVDGYQKWLREDEDFLARALNDTRHLSRVAREYLSLICPQGTRVIPGQMTAMLRRQLGLNNILGPDGEKNRNDHRHHAVDACVIAVTDQPMLQRFARASASTRERQLNRLVENIPLPWDTYREHVARAIGSIWVSHKPDHDYQDELFDQTIYSPGGFSKIAAKTRAVIPFRARAGTTAEQRHTNKNGQPKAYKGLLSNSNYCIEIVRIEGRWEGKVIPTHQAYAFVRNYKKRHHGCAEVDALRSLRNPHQSISGKPLVMRLSIDDTIRAEVDSAVETLQVLKINSSGSITFIRVNETNIPARYTAKLAAQKLSAAGEVCDQIALNDSFFQKAISAGSLRSMKARRVTITPIGELHDPGFRE
ncbi:MAG: type II CRISPR RNA-guided endonuclease Cas9, partial [Burkholderiales bacterium 66-5]